MKKIHKYGTAYNNYKLSVCSDNNMLGFVSCTS